MTMCVRLKASNRILIIITKIATNDKTVEYFGKNLSNGPDRVRQALGRIRPEE
jgi:hypothetical protein